MPKLINQTVVKTGFIFSIEICKKTQPSKPKTIDPNRTWPKFSPHESGRKAGFHCIDIIMIILNCWNLLHALFYYIQYLDE